MEPGGSTKCTVTGTFRARTMAVSAKVPVAATTRAFPTARVTARPSASSCTTAVSGVAQAIGAPGTASPRWLRATAVNARVSPMLLPTAVSGVRVR